MRSPLTIPPLALASALAIFVAAAAPALAGKPGGDGTTPPPPLPPVRYQAQLFSVPNNNTFVFNDANNLGQAVGWSVLANGEQHGWLYDPLLNPSAAIDLNDLGTLDVPEGWIIASGVGINDWGDVVGYLEQPGNNEVRQGYVLDVSYDPAVPSRLYILPHTESSYTWGRLINDNGDVLGLYQRSDLTYGAYLFHTGLACSPKPVPVVMRVSEPCGGRGETLDVEVTKAASQS